MKKLRQTSVQSYYKTLQMVYYLDTKRQLGKPMDGMIDAVFKHHLRANLCMLIRSQHIKKRLDSEVWPRSGDQGQSNMLGH